MITPINLSEYLVRFFNDIGDHISHLKIQKLLYYTDVWFRVHLKIKLFSETPQAWVHGPVYSSVYQHFKDHGANNIIIEKSMESIKDELKIIFNSKKKTKLLNDILEFYAPKSAFTLEMMTHNEKPWQDARTGYGSIEPCTKEIDMKSSRKYYSSLMKND